MAITNESGPTVLALLSEPAALRTDYREDNLVAWRLCDSDCDGDRQVTPIATGSEVEIAAMRRLLKADGINAAAVSLLSWELFDASRRNTARTFWAAHRALPSAVFGWEICWR
ncbi:transketolase-like TK C-terminal-containing protein [Thalassospira povalilytica]|uniref:transketolase-like TK C-terminal-containing protein n=1 Tax=Thalassospira povalilytica TaxID=732237 RepID=UPI003AA89884